jgi:hypothetical protein
MKSDFDLKNWPEIVERIPKTTAGRALDAKIVTEADLLRLKAIARLHARGLPPPVDWSDLPQEAFKRVLDGSLRQRAGTPGVPLLLLDHALRVESGWKFLKCRFCEKISLEEPNSMVLEPAELLQRLNTFGNDVDAQIPAYLRYAANDGLTRSVLFDAPHKIHVNLHVIRLELGKEI